MSPLGGAPQKADRRIKKFAGWQGESEVNPRGQGNVKATPPAEPGLFPLLLLPVPIQLRPRPGTQSDSQTWLLSLSARRCTVAL